MQGEAMTFQQATDTLYGMDLDMYWSFSADVNEILYGSILYSHHKGPHYELVQIFAEVLSETLVQLLENTESPFEAFDHYKENYDDLLNREINP
jgi:hypothetical protein